MAWSDINIQIDENDKKIFEKICGELGITMSTAFNIFVKAVIGQGGIPFELNSFHINKETTEAISDVNANRNLFGPFRSRKALKESLDA